MSAVRWLARRHRHDWTYHSWNVHSKCPVRRCTTCGRLNSDIYWLGVP